MKTSPDTNFSFSAAPTATVRPTLAVAACSALNVVVALLISVPHASADEPVDFNRDIRPILSETCFTCHGPAASTRKADLRLDTEEGIFADLGGYRAVTPRSLDKSELWQRVTAAEAPLRMPPPSSGRQLNARQIELLRRWIEQGARWEKHWAFVPARVTAMPRVKKADWPRNPIDYPILERLEREMLSPSPEASRESLLRRVTLDLTGLPPTLAEIDDFLADRTPNAYERVVDRLLASPRYGERMVLEWLDAARYSDTNGYQTDGTRAMWPWRDWVIKAFNDNMPFDQFTIEQLAGDMLPGATVSQKIATGFNRNHMLNGEGGRIAEESRVDYVVDRVDTAATIWLGMTAACARCHDHKYDPISQKEYYQLYAYFNSVAESGAVDRKSSTAAPIIELPTEEQTRALAAQRKVVADLEAQLKPLAEKADERKPLQQQLDAAKKELTRIDNTVLVTMIMEERKEPRDSFVLLRGIYNKYGDKVSPAVPACFPPLPKGAPNNRLGFAKWLVDRSNPLTARVIVNRYWQMFFGVGLVKTGEDFGAQGEPPTHAALLDWLAVEFMRTWDVKAMHRLIVTSATYRQSSHVTPTLLEKDPDNRLLSRGPRGRLSAFALRDQALALSGLLTERAGGPPAKPYQPPGLWEDFSFGKISYKQDKGAELYRRSLYTFWRRSIGPPNMFDASPRHVCTVRQPSTNTPLHSLILLNDVTYAEAARVWAEKIMQQAKTPQDRLRLALRQATGREPSEPEVYVLTQGLNRVQHQYAKDETAALKLVQTGEYPRSPELNVVEHASYTAVLNMVLNLDEVLTKD